MSRSSATGPVVVGTPSDTELLAQATLSLEAGIARARLDPDRPVWHFRPPARWMNDPNGTLFHKGWYHVFYQFNPYGDTWGATGTCWGHARTRDLVYWEHLPIALHPSYDRAEKRCNSGSLALDGAGRPVILYTYVPADEKAHSREQWAAFADDDDLIRWTKFAGNPVIAPGADGGSHGSWGDPFVFRLGSRVFVTGKAKRNGIPVYEATDGTLTRWAYRGPLTTFKGECPNFFPLADKWVLLTSPHGQSRWYVGCFDAARLAFTPEAEGILDHSYGPGHPDFSTRGFYATTVTLDPAGRCLLWGWASGFRQGRGWHGCLALPRILSLGPDGRPRQTPAPELAVLRGAPTRIADRPVPAGTHVLPGVSGDTLEIDLSLAPRQAAAFGLLIRCAPDGSRGVRLRCDGASLDVAGTRFALPRPVTPNSPLRLRLFLDKALLEVFVEDGAETVTRAMAVPPEDVSVAVFSESGDARIVSLTGWPLRAVWPE